MKSAAAAMIFAESLSIPAPAHTDCGDPGHDPCTGPAPTVDQVVAIVAELTDPDIPAANMGNTVTPGFNTDEVQKLDDRLNRMRGPALPEDFDLTDIQPAPNNFAGATVASAGNPR